MDEFELINYFSNNYQEYWRNEIRRGDWEGCQQLYDLLSNETFKSTYGENSKLYMATDGESLICFCGFLEKKLEADSELKPWIGFVYTFKEYRGNGYMKELIDLIASKENLSEVYVSTECNGLYEKFGFEYVKDTSENGVSNRIYKKTF